MFVVRLLRILSQDGPISFLSPREVSWNTSRNARKGSSKGEKKPQAFENDKSFSAFVALCKLCLGGLVWEEAAAVQQFWLVFVRAAIDAGSDYRAKCRGRGKNTIWAPSSYARGSSLLDLRRTVFAATMERS